MTESFFTPEATEAVKPQVQEVVDSLIDSIKERGCNNGPIDLVKELATVVNPKVILLSILKVSEKEANELIQSSSALGGTSGSASESGHTDLHEYISQLIDARIEKPRRPQDDLLSKLVVDEYRQANLDRDDLINLVYMIFVAGNSAIQSSIVLGVITLLQHQDQLEELKENPELAGRVVEEILRYHTPSALNSRRVTTTDLTLGGKVMTRTHYSLLDLLTVVRKSNRVPGSSAPCDPQTAMKGCTQMQTSSASIVKLTRTKTWHSGMARITVRGSGSPGWSCRPSSVR